MGIEWALILPALLAAGTFPGTELVSPNGNLKVRVNLPEQATWSLAVGGKERLGPCRLGLTVKGFGDLFAGVRVLDQRRRTVDERIPVLFGKASEARNHFEELRLQLAGAGGMRVDVVFRCFDDAVAFRYEIPEQREWSSVTVADERSTFGVLDRPTAYVQYLENFTTSHEHPIAAVASDAIQADTLLDTPLTLQWSDGTCLSITEAALRHYAGMSLMRRPGRAPCELASELSPRPDGDKVVRALPMASPWRVALAGASAGALLESQTLYCLNDPSEIGDTSWIQPGKMTWSWWNGYLYDAHPTPPILGLEMQKKTIDFCADNGILYHDVVADERDQPWYRQVRPGLFPGPGTDVTQVRADLDLPAVLAYAKSRGVRLWTWVHQGALRGRVEEAFAAFEKMGWSGMMVDFFDRDDQETVEYAESILKAAAKHHILIHFHGMYKPTGWQRTFPNLMNHEGSRNLEYMKWGDTCPPEHTLRVAFTRLVAGPMDYHLGGFRSVRRDQFQPHNVGPNVLGTRCFNLALYVCIDNPTPMVADYAAAYRGQPGFEFVKDVPTTWDETRVLAADIGDVLVMARRKGRAWYLGAIGANGPHDLDLDLGFLGPGSFHLDSWRDGPDTPNDPNTLVRESRTVQGSGRLKVHLAPDGGFVAKISP